MLNYWEERANQSWREDTGKMSRDQSLEPTACTVPGYYARDLLVVYLQSLSLDLPFFLNSHLWCTGWILASHISEALWQAGLFQGSASKQALEGDWKWDRANVLSDLLFLQRRLSSGTWLQLPAFISTWRNSPILRPHHIRPATGPLLGGFSTNCRASLLSS